MTEALADYVCVCAAQMRAVITAFAACATGDLVAG
jgi:hypothetical protein